MRHRSRPFKTTVYSNASSSGSKGLGGFFSSAGEAWGDRLNPNFSPVFDGPSTEVDGVDTMTDVLTPGFFTKMRKGQVLPVNPCNTEFYSRSGGVRGSFYLRRVRQNPSTGIWGNADQWNNYWCQTAPSRPSQPPPPVSAQALLTEAIGKWQQQGWDMATFAAESGKTLSMLQSAISNFNAYANQCFDIMRRRRKRLASVKEALDLFSSIWMEGRYGWRLLYYDIQGIQRTLDSDSDQSKSRFNATDTATRETTSAWTKKTNYMRYRIHTTHTYNVRAGVLGVMKRPGSIALDPIVTAWEVIPWTMVIDWFVDVGSVIRATSPFGRGTINATWTSLRVDSISTLEWELTPGEYTPLVFDIHGQATAELTTYQRVPLQPNYRPKFMPMSGLNFVDAAALAWMTRKRVLRRLRSFVQML